MTVAIIGAGHAGVQAAESLRVEGYDGRIILIDKGAHLPYQRPPLSKEFMAAGGDPAALPLRGAAFYDNHAIELRTSSEVVGIDPVLHTVQLRSGEKIGYDDLIVAVGADARRATCPGAELEGLCYLRTIDDAVDLRRRLDDAQGGRVVVVGAGFIGLEFASTAAQRGFDVTVIDIVDRPMQRALSPAMSDHFAAVHTEKGVRLVFGEGLDRFEGREGRAAGVVGTSGAVYPCDLVVVGLGVTIECAAAADAGIAGAQGIPVDEFLQTTAARIYAIGDVAQFPWAATGRKLRLESVQNATEMARTVARTIAGTPTRYDIVPWFWSHQGTAKLQIAGLAEAFDTVVHRGDPSAGAFSQFLFQGDALVAVESVNSPADHVAARKLLAHRDPLTPVQVGDPAFDLRAYARRL